MLSIIPQAVTGPADDRPRIAQSFETALEAESLSPATVRLYAHGVRRLYAYLDRVGLDVPFSSLSAEHLREWLNTERKAGASPATLEALHKALWRFWRFLREEGEVSEDVAARLPARIYVVNIINYCRRREYLRGRGGLSDSLTI